MPATPTVTPTPGPDQFTCYKAHITRQTLPFTPADGVSLVDQFASATMDVSKPVSLCNPADQNGGDPTAPAHPLHLTRYMIKAPKTAARFATIHDQRVVNQFGELFVDILKPVQLLVPSGMSLIGHPPVPVNPALDHFVCYTVRVTRGTAKFAPILGMTTITDQLGTLTVDVTKPTMLCAPTDMNNTAPGAEAHTEHLMCYKVRAVRGAPKFTKVTPVFATDHLGVETLDVISRQEICVPSLKNP